MATRRTLQPGIKNEDLPAIFHKGPAHPLALPYSNIEGFLEADLSLHRIERIYQYLWLAGRPFPPRPLHTHLVLERSIVATDAISLHLVWTPGKIFVKALPRYLTSPNFWDFRQRSTTDTRGYALGLLWSYMTLLRSELDFAVAHDAHLLPESYSWEEWKALSLRIAETYPLDGIYAHVAPRYWYGELRLSRLDKISRFANRSFFIGYSPLTNSTNLRDVFASNLNIIAASTIYIALVLTAMKVALAVKPPEGGYTRLYTARYGFAIFSMVLPFVVIVIGAVAFLIVGVVIALNSFRSVRRIDETIAV